MGGISNEKPGDAAAPGRLLVMGQVRGAFGVKGWVSVEPFTESPANLTRFRVWWIGSEGSWRRVRVVETEVHGPRLVARLEGFTERDAAAALRGVQVAVPRDSLPSPGTDEFYQADLIGLDVINREGERLGTIERIFENGAHPVLQICREGRDVAGGISGRRSEAPAPKRLIPFVGHVVEQVDLDARVVRVDWGADW